MRTYCAEFICFDKWIKFNLVESNNTAIHRYLTTWNISFNSSGNIITKFSNDIGQSFDSEMFCIFMCEIVNMNIQKFHLQG